MSVTNIRGARSSDLMAERGMKMQPLVTTMTGTIVLTVKSAPLQVLDPDGAKTVTLPAEALSEGLVFWIWNTASGAEIITIENDAAGAIATPTLAEMAICVCDGVAWHGLVVATES